ncbi:MAG: CRISPR-associated helicase Cas3' [Candidatus Cloacimonadales bacterium]
MSCRVLSHPNIDLIDHLTQVKVIGLNQLLSNDIYLEFQEIMDCVLFMHDLGKAHPDFQNKLLGNPYKEYHHAIVSAHWVYYLLREKGYSSLDSFLGFNLVYSHHGDLKSPRTSQNYRSAGDGSAKLDYAYLNQTFVDYLPYLGFFSYANFLSLKAKYGEIDNLNRRDYKQITDEYYYIYNYLFSILIYADKKSAILKQQHDQVKVEFSTWKSDLVAIYKEKKFGKPASNLSAINLARKDSFSETADKINSIDEKIVSINLPTGLGKTLNAVNIALKIKAKQGKKRVIYALPFTSIIEQNANVLEELLKFNEIMSNSSILLKQHHLVDYSYISNIELDEGESKFLIENWESEFVVTTFYQILYTLITNKNKHLIKLSNLVNSVIILDEVQNIPTKYWLLINQVLKKCSILFNIDFILTTATMPLIFSTAKQEIIELTDKHQHYFQLMDRITLNCSNLAQKIDMSELVDLILEKADSNCSQLIILNSVSASLKLYEVLQDAELDKEVLYLSTNIVPWQRLQIIKDIQAHNQNKIVVSTQLVEAGVDIDFDFVYRDLAPLDSIFQACGRCNRNNKKANKGEVILFELISANGIAYWSFIYDKHLISPTKNILGTEIISENKFWELSNQYYQHIYDYIDNSTSENLLDYIHKLNYDDLLAGDDGFVLIKDIPNASFYICINEEAEKLLKDLDEVVNREYADKFTRIVKIKDIRRKMSQYIVSVPKRFALNNQDELITIDKDNLSLYYDKNTGFKRDIKQEDLVF